MPSRKLFSVDLRLRRRRISIARNPPDREEPLQPLEHRAVQPDPDSPQVLIEMRHATSPGDRHDVRSAIQQPGQRELPRRTTDFARQAHELFQHRSILYEVFTLEAGHASADVSSPEVAQLQSIREPAPRERAEGNKRRIDLPASLENPDLRITGPE